MRHKGITLLEVIIVVAIITVLAGIVIFSLRPADVFSDSKNSKRKADKESIQKGINSYVSEKKVYPTSFSGLSEGIYDICRQGQTNCTVMSVNLDELITYGVLSKIPVDPDCTSLTDTCYNLQYIPATSEYVVLVTGEPPVTLPSGSASPTPTPTPGSTPPIANGNPTNECIMYGIDDNSEDSQLFSLNLNTGSYNNIGAPLVDYGLEAMDNMANGDLYAISYFNVPVTSGSYDSQLYQWNKTTGAATHIGGINVSGTNLQRIEAASVNPLTNVMWVFSKATDSIYTLNTSNAAATLVWQLTGGLPDNWNAMAWNNTGTEVYAIDSGVNLIKWNGATTITTLCPNLFPVETDGLEFSNDGDLIAGVNNSSNLVLVRPQTCTLEYYNYPQAFDVDIESLAFEPTCAPVTPTQCYAVSSSADDAEETLSSGSISLTGTTLDLGIPDSGQAQTTGLRFNNIQLNQGETITAANLNFTANGPSSGNVNLTIRGQKILNAPIFSTTAYNITSRTNTTSNVSWTGLPSWTDNTQHISPDLSTIVQEIINQPGWVANNSMALFITGNTGHRDASSYNQSFPESAELCITTSSSPVGSIDPDIVVNGVNDNDVTGNAQQVLSVGDINRDTYTDFVIGSPFAEDTGTDRGRVYVVLGSASIPASINAESASVVINGTNDGDQFGFSVSALADVNDDGKNDIIVGAPFAEDTGTNRGRVYVFFGGSTMPASINAENANIIINGTNDGDQLGFSVSGARDVDDDADDADEILAGAPFAQDSGTDRGRVYMIYGAKTMPANIDAENSSVIINGTNDGDQFGFSVNAVEDINNDPYYDFVVGAPLAEDAGTNRGRAYLFYGSSSLSASINAENANIIMNGTNDGDQFGYSVAGVGDVDNDNYDDITIGAPFAEDTGTDRGRVYAFFGGAGLPSTKNAESLDVIINGTDDNDQFGYSLGEAGDIDNDGKNDITVGAPLAEDGGVNRGIAYVFYGDSNIASSINAENADFNQAGIADNDQLGKSVSAKGDLNKDGKDDFMVSAPQDQDTGTDRGRVYIFLSF